MPRHIDVLRSSRNPAAKASEQPSSQAAGNHAEKELADLPFPSEQGGAPEKAAELPARGLDAFSEEEPPKGTSPDEEASRQAQPEAELPHDLDELVSEQAGKTAEEVMQELAAQGLGGIPGEQAGQALGKALKRQLPETLHHVAPQQAQADLEGIVAKLLPHALQEFTERQTEKAIEDVVKKILRGALKELTAAPAAEAEPPTPPPAAAPAEAAAPPMEAAPPPSREEVEEAPPLKELQAWFEQLAQFGLAAFRAAASGKPQDLAPLVGHIRTLAAAKHSPALIDALELHLATTHEHIVLADAELGDLVIKGMTVLLYGLKLADRLQLSVQATASLMLAGLLHHIGLAMLPASIRRKKGELSDKERQLLRDVPKMGAEFLRRCGIDDADALAAARYWRERYDGSGPEGLKGRDIPLMARIIGLLTAFEALIHYRPYRKRLLPMEAVSLMIKQSQKEFDPQLLKALIESLSLYPVGSYVQLNSGDIGLVLAVNPKLPLRPKIRLLLNRQGQEIEPREVDLMAQPNLIIQRCVYEEELKELKAKAEA